MFQISSVTEDETSDDRTEEVDVGLHFSDRAELEDYLRSIFGNDVEIEIVGED